jgi:hypothetical protein
MGLVLSQARVLSLVHQVDLTLFNYLMMPFSLTPGECLS